jgi:trigger factor
VKTTLDKTENRQAYLTIEMEPAEVEEGLKKAYNRLVQKYNVPGFRKGKAPRPILEQHIGKQALLEDAVEHMAPDAFEKAAKEKELHPISRPEIELEKADPVTYKMVVALEPIVKLGDYQKVKIAPEPVEIKPEDQAEALDNLRHQHAIWEPVERQVNTRDLLIMDIASKTGEQPYINQNDAEYQVVTGTEYPMKGFPEQIIGMKKGETKEFSLKFPEDDKRPELAGKDVNFKITIKEIKQERLAELNDDFAKQVNAEFNSLDDLKNKINESLKQVAEEKAKKDFEQKVVNEVVKISEAEYPEVLVEQEIDNLIRQQMQRWQIDEKGLDQYLQSIKKTPDELREEMRPVAAQSIKASLVLSEVAQKENVQIEKSDLENEIRNMTQNVPEERKEKILEILQMPQSQMNLAGTIATRKTLDLLTKIAQAPAATEDKAAIQTEETIAAIDVPPAAAETVGSEPVETQAAEKKETKTKESKSKKKEANK